MIWLRIVDGGDRPIALASASLFKRDLSDAHEEDYTATFSDARGLLVLSMPELELEDSERLFVRVEVEGRPIKLLSEEEIASALTPRTPYLVRLSDYAHIYVRACTQPGAQVHVGYYGEVEEAGHDAQALSCDRGHDEYAARLAPGVYHFVAASYDESEGSYVTQRITLQGGERLALDLRRTRFSLAVRRMSLQGAQREPIVGAAIRGLHAAGAGGGLSAWLNGEGQESDENGAFTLIAAKGEALELSLKAPGMSEPETVRVPPLARTVVLDRYRPVTCRFVDRAGRKAEYRSGDARGEDPVRGVVFAIASAEDGEHDFVFDWPAVAGPLTISAWGFKPALLRSSDDPCVLVRED